MKLHPLTAITPLVNFSCYVTFNFMLYIYQYCFLPLQLFTKKSTFCVVFSYFFKWFPRVTIKKKKNGEKEAIEKLANKRTKLAYVEIFCYQWFIPKRKEKGNNDRRGCRANCVL